MFKEMCDHLVVILHSIILVKIFKLFGCSAGKMF